MDYAPLFLWLSAEAWTAIGSMSTAAGFIVAAGALFYSDRQLRASRKSSNDQLKQARQAALDQARPYVLVTVETSDIQFSFLDLVISNVGAGPARDVRIEIDPPLERALQGDRHRLDDAWIFQDTIPMLPPHYRLATFFDSAIDRHEHDREEGATPFPKRHAVSVSYHDGHGNSWQEEGVIDLRLHDGLLFSERYGLHHAAKALRGIEKLLEKEAKKPREVNATTETRAERVARETEEHRRRQAQMEEFRRRQEEARDGGEAG